MKIKVVLLFIKMFLENIIIDIHVIQLYEKYGLLLTIPKDMLFYYNQRQIVFNTRSEILLLLTTFLIFIYMLQF